MFKPFISGPILLRRVFYKKNTVALSKHLKDYIHWVFTRRTSVEERLNQLTGYTKIEQLKNQIREQETHLKKARIETKEAKSRHTLAVQQRLKLQQEVNELLQRKHQWTQKDLENFTSLYRNDHINEQKEQNACSHLVECEEKLEELQTQLSQSILSRYHEEQMWSDKIRRLSTWGTWSLIGFNIILFLVIQLGLEPRKKRLLINDIEKRIQLILGQYQNSFEANQSIFNASDVSRQISEDLSLSVLNRFLTQIRSFYYNISDMFLGKSIPPATVSLLCLTSAFIGVTLSYLIQLIF
ncbi:hypothetical protein PCK1_001568 [Pneumocystis canis]|nr:hypothetical protein PCK1_001568 [Pneumocystis canis]